MVLVSESNYLTTMLDLLISRRISIYLASYLYLSQSLVVNVSVKKVRASFAR